MNKPVYNPCDPQYRIRDENGNVIVYGDVAGSKPKVGTCKTNPDEMDRSLKVSDIDGNKPGTRGLGAFHSRERRQIRNIGKNDDIEGSNSGSLVMGIRVPKGV